MRTTNLLVLVIMIGISFSLSSKQISWFDPKTENSPVFPSFFESGYYSEGSLLPSYFESLEALPGQSWVLKELKYEPLSAKELQWLEQSAITLPDSLVLYSYQAVSAKQSYNQTSFIPLVNHQGVASKVVSFEWEQLHSPTAKTTTATGIHSYATESVLASGKWAKVRVGSTGMFQITASQLAEWGFNDISKVKIYGYGGAVLEENFRLRKIDDLPEIPAYRYADKLIFYGVGPTSWKYEDKTLFAHRQNSYSFYGYYFITEGDNPLSISQVSVSTTPTSKTLTSFEDYALHEVDLYNFIGSGQEFYGEDFSVNSKQSFPMRLTDAVGGTTARLDLNLACRIFTSANLNVTIGSAMNFSIPLPTSPTNFGYEKAKSLDTSRLFTVSASDINVTLNISKSGDLVGRLNYLRINYKRALSLNGSYLLFRSTEQINNNVTYKLTVPNSNIAIWDVTYKDAPVALKGAAYVNSSLMFTPAQTDLREYVAFDPAASFSTVEYVGNVTNQNLHGLPQCDMMIITHPDFFDQALRLAQMHEQKDRLKVHITLPEQIYNEYSSGTPDATAYRWLMKMFYDRAVDAVHAPKYLLLLGDGTFDNRLVSSEWKVYPPSNKLLTFQAKESLNETASYVTDDYFGFLDDNEGSSLGSDLLDLGIGRFPVSTRQQAEEVTSKVLHYVQNSQLGPWKNRVLYLADDGDNNLHLRDADTIATRMDRDHPEIIVNKIYLDAFKQITGSTGESYPDARKLFQDLLNQGLLVVNYTGHGSTQTWSNEQLLVGKDVKNMRFSKLPLWVTATCDFSRFDDFATSAGENILLNPISGGIALFTTVRVVYSGPNFVLNSSFNRMIFNKSLDGSRVKLGDNMRLTKRSIPGTDTNKLNFILLGDPALTLSYPSYSAKVDKFNNQPANQTGQLSALSLIEVEGSILAEDGMLAENFNGKIYPTVLDAEMKVNTLANDYGSKSTTFKERSNVLFSGVDTVMNGRFKFSFIAPKDISYSDLKGRINLYAADRLNNHEAQGAFQNFLVGGTSPNINPDGVGPKVKLYLNSPSFVSGGRVDVNPTLIAEFEDESGINGSGSSIGHDIYLVVDNSPYSSYSLNSYYTAYSGDYKKGTLRYIIPNLTQGHHTLSLRVWDMQNNSTVETLDFEVVNGIAPKVSVTTDRNPVSQRVQFIVKHDRPETELSTQIEIFDPSGRIIWSYISTGISTPNATTLVNWDLILPGGKRIDAGLYYYRVKVGSEKGNYESQTQKLIVIKQ